MAKRLPEAGVDLNGFGSAVGDEITAIAESSAD
jgi:hypothetical protein